MSIAGLPTVVITELYIASLGSINTVNMVTDTSLIEQASIKLNYFIIQDYTTDTYLIQKWTDPRLASESLKVCDLTLQK